MKKEHAACAIGMELPGDHPLRQSLTDAKATFEELMDEFLICMKLNMISLLKLLCFPLRMRHWPKKNLRTRVGLGLINRIPGFAHAPMRKWQRSERAVLPRWGVHPKMLIFFEKHLSGSWLGPWMTCFNYIYIYICIYIFGICDKKNV